MKNIPRLFELLEMDDFRSKTVMYIGERKISTLSSFLEGALYALDAYGVERKDNEPDFREFHDWVSNYYGRDESTAGWKNIILEEVGGNEEKAVDEFFKLFDEFKTEKIAPDEL